MIEVRNLTKSYGRFRAVDDISFRISAGEIIGFLGPNGAGKTTTMRMLTGFLGPDAGSIEIDNQSILENAQPSKEKIGYLPENNPLYEDMTVVEYLNYIGEMRGMSADLRQARLQLILGLYGLTEVTGKDIGELSKGYRQRVGLAQAALHDPPIMILDEPTSGLDPNQIVEIRNLIKEIGKTKTVILSTHNLGEVEATCSRILIINKGKIVADDKPENLEQAGAGPILHVKIKGGAELPRQILTVGGIRGIKDQKVEDGWHNFALIADAAGDGQRIGEKVFEAAVAHGWKLSELYVENVSLEDVFSELTKG